MDSPGQSRRRKSTSGPSLVSVALVTVLITLLGIGGLALIDAFGSRGSGGPVGGPATTEGPGDHAVSTDEGPDLHFATNAVDFGVVPLNTEVGYTFSYANVGNEVLKIEDVKVSVEEGC